MGMTSSLLRLTVIALPIALGGCADSWDELRAFTGEDVWSADELAASPYERGKEHFAEGRYGLAVKQFEAALVEDPNSIEVLNGLGAAFDKLGRYEQAERFYQRALIFEPQSAQTLNNLGYSYLMRGRYDLALTYLSDAQALDPENAMVSYNLQQAQTGLNLGEEDYAAAPLGEDDFEQLAQWSRSARLTTGEAPADLGTASPLLDQVHIRALSARGDDIWIERTSPMVQTLVTQPRPDVLLRARNAGLEPRMVNYRGETATTPRRRPAGTWQTRRALGAPAGGLLLAESQPRPQVVAVSEGNVKGSALELDGGEESSGEGEGRLPEGPAAAVEPRMTVEVRVAALDSSTQSSAAMQGEAPTAPPSSRETPVIEVSNGTGRLEMALRISNFLGEQGVPTTRLTNAEHFRHQETTVFYRAGWLETAKRVADQLPAETELAESSDQTSDIRIELGGDLLDFDQELFYAGTKPSPDVAG